MDVRVGLQGKLSIEELVLLNTGVGEDLRVPWTARKSNQSILKEISPEYSLEGLMLKLKLQYFGHLMTHWNWLTGKDPHAGKGGRQEEKGITEWDGWMASPTQWTWVWASSGSWWWTREPGVLQSMGLQRVKHNWVTELNWVSWKQLKNPFHLELSSEVSDWICY